MKRYGKLHQEAEITLSNSEWNASDRERIFSEAETILFEKIREVTDAVEMDGKINPEENSILFLVTYQNNGSREFYPGEHNFDGKQADIDELDVEDPEEIIREQMIEFEDNLNCDIFFRTINKEWQEK